jgi:hypothetical protein
MASAAAVRGEYVQILNIPHFLNKNMATVTAQKTIFQAKKPGTGINRGFWWKADGFHTLHRNRLPEKRLACGTCRVAAGVPKSIRLIRSGGVFRRVSPGIKPGR